MTSGAGGVAGSGAGGLGGAGTGGGGGSGPCSDLCGDPTSVAIRKNSGDLGIEATCTEVLGSASGMVCGNFVPPRTLSVNGTIVSCTGNITLPAERNGGFCFQATAGQYPYAYFSTF